MDIVSVLIANSVALGICAVLLAIVFAAMLRAEYKVYRLGGKSWAFKQPKPKKKRGSKE